jgi:hypothetical protein
MGCCSCCGDSGFEDAFNTAQFKEWNKQFKVMQLSKNELRKMYKIYVKVDVDKSGTIGLPELLAHIDLERTRFTEKIFSIFDTDKSGEIDFKEFVLSLWNYCTLTKATLGTQLQLMSFDCVDLFQIVSCIGLYYLKVYSPICARFRYVCI